MPALVAGISIHMAMPCRLNRDRRVKPGDDKRESLRGAVATTLLRSRSELRQVWSPPKLGERRRKAGSQRENSWIPAFAGMSGETDTRRAPTFIVSRMRCSAIAVL